MNVDKYIFEPLYKSIEDHSQFKNGLDYCNGRKGLDWNNILETIDLSNRTSDKNTYFFLEYEKEKKNKDGCLIYDTVEMELKLHLIHLIRNHKHHEDSHILRNQLDILRSELIKQKYEYFFIKDIPVVNISVDSKLNKFFVKNNVQMISGYLEFSLVVSYQ